MQSNILRKAIEASADPNRAGDRVEKLQETSAARALKKPSVEQARILVSLLAGSESAGELLLAHPGWLEFLEPDFLRHPRREEGLRREMDQWLKTGAAKKEAESVLARLREFKQREMFRIAARDLARLGTTLEITREISDVADVCLDTVCRLCLERLTRRMGEPYHADAEGRWKPTRFCVVGLGKLGAQELNYSSDVDVIFVYSDEGHVFKSRPRAGEQIGKGPPSHQFFARLAEQIIAEVTRLTAEGSLFRIDLRLRPEGASGPLARSLASYENFYAQWGQTWERMMLVKARPVAGNAELGAEFLEMIQPFRYPRSLGERTLRDISAMKARIENEVVRAGELDRNVKLGRGGIREVEFVAQALQLINAGRMPFLQCAPTVPALEKLASYGLLPPGDAALLCEAYLFLRDVEHRLQMEAGQQTHTIPTERRARERLARLMGFDSISEFESGRQKHSRQIRRVYEKILAGEDPAETSPLPREFAGAEEQWRQLLSRHRFRDPPAALRMVQMFIDGPGHTHVSRRTSELARELFPGFLALCPDASSPVGDKPRLSDPDRVLVRLQSYVEAYGARAPLYEMWTRKPSLFRMLLLLFDRSEFLAEKAVRAPDLVDELQESGRLRRQKDAEETLRDLRHGLRDHDQRAWVRRYHEAEIMRIGLRDILGLADFEQNLVELSALAEACLRYALDVALREHGFKTAPFAIIGMGKLGGREVDYGSDLDIVFATTPGTRNSAALQHAAAGLMDLLSRPTELGIVFRTDARLRPDGEKGLLVNSLDAYEQYYRRRAALWEIQTLTRARAVAGDPSAGAHFQQLAARLANFSSPPNDLACWTPGWQTEIARMRELTLKERTPPGKDHLAIKTGTGGLMDAEFMAQMFCLSQGWHEPNTLNALRRGSESGLLTKGDGARLLENYRKLRRIEGILRRWSFEGETVLPEEEAPLNRVALRCGFNTAGDFMKELGRVRAAIRSVYNKVFPP